MTTLSLMKSMAKEAWRRSFPRQFAGWELRRMQESPPVEAEMHLLPALVNPLKMGLDVGASRGCYTVKILKYASSVIAFEPQVNSEVSEIFKMAGSPVQWLNVAISNRNGTIPMRVVAEADGLSTIEPLNDLNYQCPMRINTISVTTRRLDDYGLTDVGFIKIDVEGHEMSVLEGSTETINRNRCTMLIECEERHRPGATKELFQWAQANDYDSFFLLEGKIINTSEFSLEAHQDPANLGNWMDGWKKYGIYINNFLFVPTLSSKSFQEKCSSLLGVV